MIDWNNINFSVPHNREKVLVWGISSIMGFHKAPGFLGVTKYNPGDKFDIEKPSILDFVMVTHWAKITGPLDTVKKPPKRL